MKMQIEHTLNRKVTMSSGASDIQKVLLIGNDKNRDIALLVGLTGGGYHVVYCDSVKKAWPLVYPHRPDVIILRLGNADASGLADLQECRALAEGVPIVVTIGGQVSPNVMPALQHGAAVVVPEVATPDSIRRAFEGLCGPTA
jgi:DNA-binding NtrC family response regulator